MHQPFIAQRVALGYNIHNNPVEMGARVSFDATAALLLWSAEQLRNALECGDFSVPMDDLLIGQPVDPDIEQGVIAEEALLDWLSRFGIHDPCQTLTDRVWQALVDAVSQGEPVTARLLSAHAADLLDLALVTHATPQTRTPLLHAIEQEARQRQCVS